MAEVAHKRKLIFPVSLFVGPHNHDLAVDLFDQLSQEFQEFDRLPAVVLGYGIKHFDKGTFGVGLTYMDGTEIRTDSILAQKSGNFSDADVSLETGLPTTLNGGNRTLYTASQKSPSKNALGISRLVLCGDLYVGAGDDYLANSNGYGRVVLF